MTQSQASASDLWITRLLLWVPAGAGGVLALLVLALGSIPLISQVQLQGRQVEEKRAQEQRLPQLRSDQAQVAAQQLVAERQQQQLISLIAGSGELVTFMAQADREARRHGVQLQLYEPRAELAVADADKVDFLKGQAKGTRDKLEKEAATKKEADSAAQNDPLQKAGLKSTNLLLSARGRYPNLLAFMRGMESVGLLVVPSNLNLQETRPPQGAAGASNAPQQVAPVELKLGIALYNAKASN